MPITANEWMKKEGKVALVNVQLRDIRKVYKPARIFKHILQQEKAWTYEIVTECSNVLINCSTAFITWEGVL